MTTRICNRDVGRITATQINVRASYAKAVMGVARYRIERRQAALGTANMSVHLSHGHCPPVHSRCQIMSRSDAPSSGETADRAQTREADRPISCSGRICQACGGADVLGTAIACAGRQIPCDSITIMGCAVSPAGRTLLYEPTATQDPGRLQATDVRLF